MQKIERREVKNSPNQNNVTFLLMDPVMAIDTGCIIWQLGQLLVPLGTIVLLPDRWEDWVRIVTELN